MKTLIDGAREWPANCVKYVNVHHRHAMELAQEALLARHRGDDDEALRLSREAFTLAREAAAALVDHRDHEPSRLLLHDRAAVLAFQCGEYDEAERLIGVGLDGNPPAEIAEELRDLLGQVRCRMRRSREEEHDEEPD